MRLVPSFCRPIGRNYQLARSMAPSDVGVSFSVLHVTSSLLWKGEKNAWCASFIHAPPVRSASERREKSKNQQTTKLEKKTAKVWPRCYTTVFEWLKIDTSLQGSGKRGNPSLPSVPRGRLPRRRFSQSTEPLRSRLVHWAIARQPPSCCNWPNTLGRHSYHFRQLHAAHSTGQRETRSQHGPPQSHQKREKKNSWERGKRLDFALFWRPWCQCGNKRNRQKLKQVIT